MIWCHTWKLVSIMRENTETIDRYVTTGHAGVSLKKNVCHGKNPNMVDSKSFARVAEKNILRHSIDDAMCSEN